MRAAVFHGPKDIRFETMPDPVPGPGDVVVRMLACGVCGSDLMDWYTAGKAPAVLGHEPVGIVVAIGDGGDRDRLPEVGARVFVHHHVPCFTCELCRAGRHTLCPSFHRSSLKPGGFAELVLVPAALAAVDLLTVPDHVTDEECTLVEPLACCLRSLRRAGVSARTRLAIVGLGQMGLLHVQAARALGCDRVMAVDPLPSRRALAAGFGATPGTPADAAELAASIGGAPDVVILTTPVKEAFAEATTTVRPGGVVQLFAPTAPGVMFSFDQNDLFFREITIQSTYSAGPEDVRDALALLAAGRVHGGGIITHRFGLADTADALATARSAEAIKVVVVGAS